MRRATRARLVSAGLALAILCVFSLAALLEPSSHGHGTHTQLGLGTCSFLALTGQPCPMCGATTTWTLLAHFRPIAALRNQPFAALLFTITAGVFGVAISEVLDPRERWSRLAAWLGPREGRVAAGFLALMALGWVYKAVLMGIVGKDL